MADWLDDDKPAVAEAADVKIEDANAHVVPAQFADLVASCMRGTDRVMCTNGQYLAYRPYNRDKDKETNPRTKERVAMFLSQGAWIHVGTWDEVQVYELLDGNAYHHKRNYVVGRNMREDMTAVAKAAIERRWPEYHDLLSAMATAMKSGRDPAFAGQIFKDMLGSLGVMIQQIGGDSAPTEREINEGFVGVRKARGMQSKGSILQIDTSGLQKVGFSKGGK
jgi:hypothetical protein